MKVVYEKGHPLVCKQLGRKQNLLLINISVFTAPWYPVPGSCETRGKRSIVGLYRGRISFLPLGSGWSGDLFDSNVSRCDYHLGRTKQESKLSSGVQGDIIIHGPLGGPWPPNKLNYDQNDQSPTRSSLSRGNDHHTEVCQRQKGFDKWQLSLSVRNLPGIAAPPASVAQ